MVAFAKLLHELDRLDGIGQERHLAIRPTMSEVYYLVQPAPQLSRPTHQTGIAPVVNPIPSITRQNEEARFASAAAKDRALVRALILGNENPEDISELLDLSPEALRIYEHLDFDVRSRLNKRGWLHNYVFTDTSFGSTSVGDFERMCLLLVYRHGTEALKQMLYMEYDHDRMTEDLRKMIQRDVSVKAATSLMAMPYNSHTIPELVSGYKQWDKTERELVMKASAGEQAGSTGTDADVGDQVYAALNSMGVSQGFTVAEPPLESEEPDPAEEHQPDEPFMRAMAEIYNEMGLKELIES